MTEQVDVKKLAEWAFGKNKVRLLWGFTDFDTGYFNPVPPEYKKDKYDTEQALCFLHPEYFIWWVVPDFPNDLNACFEWLEPPLYERFGIYHIGFARVVGVGYNCFMNRHAVNWPYREEGLSKELTTLGYGESLGEAFCDAALKVIDKYPELIKPIDKLIDNENRR